MSEWNHCDICGEYADMDEHRRYTRVYVARLDDEEEWRRVCGDYHPGLEQILKADDVRTAAARFCRRMDAEESHIVTDNRTVWVRLEGDEGEGQPVRVETEMVPEYRGVEMVPCSAGCGQFTTIGGLCHTCMMAEIRAKRAAAG